MAFGRHRRRRRHYRGFVTLPGFRGLTHWNVKFMDVLIGGGLGFAGSAVLKAVANKVFVDSAGNSTVPSFVQQFWPAIGSVGGGFAAYMLEKKSHHARAQGHLAGAVLAGLAVSGWSALQNQFPGSFSDVVQLRLGRYGRRYGVPVNEATPRIGPGGMAGYRGVIVNEPVRQLSAYNLGQLHAASLGEDDDGMDRLMDMAND